LELGGNRILNRPVLRFGPRRYSADCGIVYGTLTDILSSMILDG
jgi:hypothetical protein